MPSSRETHAHQTIAAHAKTVSTIEALSVFAIETIQAAVRDDILEITASDQHEAAIRARVAHEELQEAMRSKMYETTAEPRDPPNMSRTLDTPYAHDVG